MIPGGSNPLLTNPLSGPAQLTPGNSFAMQSSGAAGGPIPSFFDVFVTLNVDVSQVGQADQIFSGSFSFDPNSGDLIPSGNPNDLFSTAVLGQLANGSSVPVSLATGINVLTNTPFDAQINLTMSMGDPNNPMAFTPNPAFNAAPIGAGG